MTGKTNPSSRGLPAAPRWLDAPAGRAAVRPALVVGTLSAGATLVRPEFAAGLAVLVLARLCMGRPEGRLAAVGLVALGFALALTPPTVAHRRGLAALHPPRAVVGGPRASASAPPWWA